MKLSSKIFLLFVFFLSVTFAKAQSDSTLVVSDTSKVDTSSKKKFRIKPYKEWSKPEKAGVFSAVIPGLGQAYNKKYWKLPIIYGAGTYLLSSVFYHHIEYRKLRDGVNNFIWEDTAGVQIPHPITMRGKVFYLQEPYEIYNEDQYRTARDQQRGKRDIFIVYSTAFYLIQIVDAVVDAHLNEFDLSDDLSLEINPNIINRNNTFATGLSLKLNIK